MTPRRLDWQSVRPKLRQIERLVGVLVCGLSGLAAEAGAIGAGAIDAGLAGRLRPSAGMRNVLVHAYLDVDHAIVAGAVPRAIADYTDFARRVAAWFGAAGHPDERA